MRYIKFHSVVTDSEVLSMSLIINKMMEVKTDLGPKMLTPSMMGSEHETRPSGAGCVSLYLSLFSATFLFHVWLQLLSTAAPELVRILE